MADQPVKADHLRSSLAYDLFREVPQDFFQILASPKARLYLDALNGLSAALSEGGSLSRSEAIEVVTEVLREHPEYSADDSPSEEESAEPNTLSGQANLVIRRLVETRWLHEPQRADYQKIVTLDAHGEVLLAALKQIARGESAQFTDKIQIACGALLSQDAFLDQPLSDLEGCLSNLQSGLRELRQMQKSIERHTRHLIDAESIREIQHVLFDEFSENIGRACYRELVHAQLPTKLPKARIRVDELVSDDLVIQKMQSELLRRNSSVDATDALNRVRLKLEDLARLLETVEPQADEIDDRAAEFARRSFARFKYMQEVTSGHRERVQALFETVNRCCAGSRLSDLNIKPQMPALLIAEVGILAGDSMYSPRLGRGALQIEPIADDVTEEERSAALAEMDSNLRNSLNVARANRFIAQLPGKPGARISTSDISIQNDEDVADLIGCFLHAESRDAAFQVDVPRVSDSSAPVQVDLKAGYSMERFIVIKK